MHVQKLSLNGYRNLEPLTLTFDNSVILFLGENAQGKTNLIESLYVLGFAKSHRTSKDRELIAWGEEHARIHGEIEKRTSSLTLDVQFAKQGSKRAKLNGLEQERISQYIGALNVVLFAPEDLNLVKGGPKERRRFIDMEIGQISNVYLHDLSLYYKTLKQRNQLLKDYWSKKDPIMLEVLTEQLIAAAAKVVSRRFVFLDKLQSWAAPIHEQISRGLEDLRLDYVSTAEVSQTSDLSTIEERYREAFHKKKKSKKFAEVLV